MSLSPIQAYRLGSMPGRVCRERQRAGWPGEDRVGAIVALLDEWLALLKAAGDRTLMADVRSLKDVIEAEHQQRRAAEWRQRQKYHAWLLEQLGEGPLPELPPEDKPSGDPDSLELARSVREKAEVTDVRNRMPVEVREAFDIGVLVGRCMGTPHSEQDTIALWTALGRNGLLEWVTGRPIGTPTEVSDSISEIIVDRLPQLDEMLSKYGVPVPKINPTPTTRDQADTHAKLDLTVAEVQKVGHDIADYADALSKDASSPAVWPSPVMMTPNEAAKEFGVSGSTLRAEFDAGHIKGRWVGTHRKLDRNSVIAWCEGREQARQSKQPVGSEQKPRKPPRHI